MRLDKVRISNYEITKKKVNIFFGQRPFTSLLTQLTLKPTEIGKS